MKWKYFGHKHVTPGELKTGCLSDYVVLSFEEERGKKVFKMGVLENKLCRNPDLQHAC